MISKEQIPFNNVTFEPGCRNNWHIHRATKGGGQMLDVHTHIIIPEYMEMLKAYGAELFAVVS